MAAAAELLPASLFSTNFWRQACTLARSISDAGVTSLTHEVGRRVGVSDVLPVLEHELRRMLRWEEYHPTPDYEARPEPGRAAVGGPRVEVISPSAPTP